MRVISFDLNGFGATWTTMMLAGGAVPRLDTTFLDALKPAHSTVTDFARLRG
ncbi:hypothetical protein ACFCWT_04400 [Streptomyces olivaceus]|uniref:hypothetical protein n=1 Tax=Streptomyces olivaceus TaxID=47716 RepID=UPI0035DFAEEF